MVFSNFFMGLKMSEVISNQLTNLSSGAMKTLTNSFCFESVLSKINNAPQLFYSSANTTFSWSVYGINHRYFAKCLRREILVRFGRNLLPLLNEATYLQTVVLRSEEISNAIAGCSHNYLRYTAGLSSFYSNSEYVLEAVTLTPSGEFSSETLATGLITLIRSLKGVCVSIVKKPICFFFEHEPTDEEKLQECILIHGFEDLKSVQNALVVLGDSYETINYDMGVVNPDSTKQFCHCNLQGQFGILLSKFFRF